jgi:hypothetical protein
MLGVDEGIIRNAVDRNILGPLLRLACLLLNCKMYRYKRYFFSVITKYSTLSPFAGVTFLKTPAKGKTAMREVQTLWEKWS